MENLPAVVIKSAGDDFSVYLLIEMQILKLEPRIVSLPMILENYEELKPI
jgi:hypothetical protein